GAGFALAGLASLMLAPEAANPPSASAVGGITSTVFMSGCVALVARNQPLSYTFEGSRIVRVERPDGLPIGDEEVEVWEVPSPQGRVYAYASPKNPSTCYVSVFDTAVAEVAPDIRTFLTSQGSPLSEGPIQQVEGTGAAQIVYTSTRASWPVVVSLIANSGADSSVPSVQLAVQRIP
ncbi:MAG TPA: hypothetical protein VIG84_08630, partial [Brevundimonas sp.]